MQWNRLLRAKSATCARTRSARLGGWRRTGLFMAAIVAGVLICSTPLRSLADGLPPGDTVYIYINGVPTNETSQVFFVGSQAYLYPNNPMAITLNYEEGHVYDQYNHLIGYITTAPPG